MSESVDILVAAENKASPVFDRVGGDAERLGARVKETGKKVKASTELVGSFANVLGNTQFGGAAGQLAQLTERVSAFSEVAKQGGVAALALKASIAGAVAVASFKIGESIGNWVWETERWKKELEAAAKAAAKAQVVFETKQQRRFAEKREDISLERKPEDREKATQSQIEKLRKEAEGMEARINLARKEVEDRKAANDSAWFKGNSSEELKIAEQQLATILKNKEALDKERESLEASVSARAKEVEARKASNAAADRSDAFVDSLKQELSLLEAVTEAEKRKVMAGRNAPTRSNEAAAIQERIDALKQEQSEQKRIEAAQDRELDRLELKRIEIEKGKEAAKAYALQMEGMSEEFARNIAAREAAMDAMSKSKPDKSPQMAVQGRLLTRGDVTDPVVGLLEKLVAGQKESTRDISKALRESAKDEPWTVNTVTVP